MLPVTSRLEIKHGGAVVGELFRCCVVGEIVMSGRGRGRGRGKSFGNLEAIGLKPGDRIPPPILQPPPLYPPRVRRPLELDLSQTDHDLLCIKQRLRQFMRQSPFFLKSEISDKPGSIERYRDRYTQSNGTNHFSEHISIWKSLPRELQIQSSTKKKKRLATSKRYSSGNNVSTGTTGTKAADVTGRLEQLDKDEQTGSEGEMTGGETEEEYDEEVEEEAGDYQQSYFDPGDEYAVDEDDALEDGPSY